MSRSALSRSNRRPQTLARRAAEKLQVCYDRLWSEGIDRIRAGTVELDAVLAAGVPDRRRGLTVIARPSARVKQSVGRFLRELRQIDPQQYYYAASEFHVTVLSLFTATVDHQSFFALQDRFVSTVDQALQGARPICIRFSGVTVSPGTVMIQGFFDGEHLNRIRDDLRRRLREAGLATTLDQRYRLSTAHMTVARFRTPIRKNTAFVRALERARQRSFGTTTVRALLVVSNDWYLSGRATQIVKRYRLPFAAVNFLP